MGGIPQRTCIGCRRTGPAPSFTRVFRDSEGRVVIWDKGPTSGRSAYVCPNEACIDAATRKERLARAWRKPVGVDELERLKQLLLERLTQE